MEEIKEKDPKAKKIKYSKDIINIIRTTQRNNIELTHIADNKANVLLSLNAIMLTFLIPLILPNLETILAEQLYVPLIILAVTCFSTIYISTLVLRPGQFTKYRQVLRPDMKFSPFFFGNYYKMEPGEFFDYLNENLNDKEMVKTHLAQDMYYVGRRLGQKMSYIRVAFNLFTIGILFSLIATAIVLYF